MHIAILDSLNDPAVRDLAWVIGSPGLADALYPEYQGRVVDDVWCGLQLEQAAPWLQAMDSAPQSLHDYIAARPTRRLGHYFETLLTFWLTHLPGTQLIATNLQVQQGQRTLGEYDLLFRDAGGEVCHWEAAVKFYLQAKPLPEASAFIGPGTRDRLDLKLERIFGHQLMLGQSAAGQQALPPGINLKRTQALIRGYLFYHSTAFNRNAIPGISSAHLSGWWMRHTLDTLPQSTPDSRWILLPRMRWLSPASLPPDAEVMTPEAVNTLLDSHFHRHPDAVLLFEMQRSRSGWEECSRGFVVCATWPIITENFSANLPAPEQ